MTSKRQNFVSRFRGSTSCRVTRREAPGPKPVCLRGRLRLRPPATRILAALEWWSSARSLNIRHGMFLAFDVPSSWKTAGPGGAGHAGSCLDHSPGPEEPPILPRPYCNREIGREIGVSSYYQAAII